MGGPVRVDLAGPRSQGLNRLLRETKFVNMITDASMGRPLGRVQCMRLICNRAAWLAILATVPITLQPVLALDMEVQPHPPLTIPLPPPRPAGIGSPATVQSPSALPDPAVPGMAPAPSPYPPPQPRNLPPASRARMHECALAWQKMKESGAATDKIWYEFAQDCLVK